MATALAAGRRSGAPVLAWVLAWTMQGAGAEALGPLLSRVLDRDPQVRVAQSLLEAGDARVRQLRSRFWPALGLNATLGQGTDLDFGLPVERRTERSELSLRWNLYNGGNDDAELNALLLESDAARAEVARAREEATTRIAEAYLDLLRTDALLPPATARVEAVQRLVAIVQRQTTEGKASEADLQQALASQVDGEVALEQLRAEHFGARRRLAQLAGEEVAATGPVVLPPGAGAAGSRPAGLQAAQLRAAAARARVRPVESLAAPRANLDLRQRLSDNTRPQASTVQRSGWNLQLTWELPLGGESFARLDEAASRAAAATAEVERLDQERLAEHAALLPRIAAAERAVALLAAPVAQWSALIRAGELQFEAGRRSLQQLIVLREGLYTAQQRLAEQANQLVRLQLRLALLDGRLLAALGL